MTRRRSGSSSAGRLSAEERDSRRRASPGAAPDRSGWRSACCTGPSSARRERRFRRPAARNTPERPARRPSHPPERAQDGEKLRRFRHVMHPKHMDALQGRPAGRREAPRQAMLRRRARKTLDERFARASQKHGPAQIVEPVEPAKDLKIMIERLAEPYARIDQDLPLVSAGFHETVETRFEKYH